MISRYDRCGCAGRKGFGFVKGQDHPQGKSRKDPGKAGFGFVKKCRSDGFDVAFKRGDL